MAVERLTVSLDAAMVQQIRGRAAGRGDSVSSWLLRAASHQLSRERALDVVGEFEAESGAFTETELDEIRRWSGW